MGDNFSGLRRLDRVFRVSYEERLQHWCPYQKSDVISINLLAYNFLSVSSISQRLPWQRYSAAKRPTQFFKNNLKTDLVT